MTKAQKIVCALLSLVFASATAVLYASRGSVHITWALLPLVLQLFVFILLREKNMITYALTLIPSALFALRLLGEMVDWYCIGTLAALYLACRWKWPEFRHSTHYWMGAFAIMVTLALVAAMYIMA